VNLQPSNNLQKTFVKSRPTDEPSNLHGLICKAEGMKVSRYVKAEPERYALILRPLTTGWRTSGLQRLRAALKRFLRDYGLRCEDVRPVKEEGKK
jgi:hypothetical protein